MDISIKNKYKYIILHNAYIKGWDIYKVNKNNYYLKKKKIKMII